MCFEQLSYPSLAGILRIVVVGAVDRRAYSRLTSGGPFDTPHIMVKDEYCDGPGRPFHHRFNLRVVVRPHLTLIVKVVGRRGLRSDEKTMPIKVELIDRCAAVVNADLMVLDARPF